MKEEIQEVFRAYLKAIYTQDFEAMFSLLYEDDAINFKNKMLEFAYKMDEFGETQGFLKRIGFKSIKQLKKLSLI